MNRFSRFASFAALLTFLGAAGAAQLSAQATPNIGYVNTQRILAEAPATAQAQQTLESELQASRTEVQQLEQELETLQQEYERQAGTLSPEARQQRQQQFQTKLQEAQQRAMALEQRAQQRRQELIAPIMQRIQTVIEEVRAEGNYALILDASALLAGDPTLDLTDRVLARLGTGAGEE